MSSTTQSSQRGTIRALAVLRALNEHNGARVSDLARVTGISRPSLYRILETLCSAGYICRRENDERYHLTMLVRALSDGFDDEQWVRNVAMPFLSRLQRQIVWPVDLVTYHGDAMYLRETTRRNSPLTLDRITVGFRMPMLLSATGRTYLAFCPATERETILENLRHSNAATDALAKDRRLVEMMLAETRRNGYGQRMNEVTNETGGVAVPIMHGERVLGCIHVAFFARVTTPAEVAARHLPLMQQTARQIESMLDLPPKPKRATSRVRKLAGGKRVARATSADKV
jgi:IclR family mhp operon transcriptional activator